MSESFAELLSSHDLETKLRTGSCVKAKIIDIQDRVAILNSGLKSESMVPISQFYDENGELEIKIGDEIEVILDAVEDGHGYTRLSREKLKKVLSWKRLEEAHRNDEIVSGRIVESVRKGVIVESGSVRAFLPGSLIDVRPIKDLASLEGKDIEFKVVSMNNHNKNIVVSRKAAMDINSEQDREKLFASLKEHSEITGIVKNITDYGAFIDLGGIDGLLHITDMAWKRVKDPSEIVQLDQEIKVKVLKFDQERSRVSLGLKQLTDDPWNSFADSCQVGQRLEGTVNNIAHYGCFVELAEGVEGLVHVSEMDWSRKNINPNKLFHIGQKIEVMLLEVDKEKRRISLGYKQCTENPWEVFEKNHKIGESVFGKIRSITDFGLFVELEEGVDGLVHVSDISWDEDPDSIRNYQKGTEIEAMVLRVDEKRERISLGIKQLKHDPFGEFIALHQRGGSVTGEIITVEEEYVKIQLAPDVSVDMPISELASEDKGSGPTIKEGQSIEIAILEIDRKRRYMKVSAKAEQEKQEQEALKEYRSEEQLTTTKLGDLFKEKLDQ